MAAASAVPLPYSKPEILVVSVNAGVAPPLDVPAKPLADTTETAVTVPEPLLLNVVQSVEVRYPLVDPLAAAIEMAGVVPPLDTTGAVPVTEVTVPPEPVADSVPAAKLTPEPIVTLLKPPDPLPYKIDVPLVAGALLLKVFQSVDVR